MKRSRLGTVLFFALLVSLANDVASDYRLLSRAFVPAWDRFGTQLTDATLDNQEPLANDPQGDAQRAAAPVDHYGKPHVGDTEHGICVVVPANRLSRAPPSA